MRIRTINKIKNLGFLFSNYTKKSDLPDFKQHNIVYGSNGSGKTTLSRLFGGVGDSAEDLEYEIEDETGKKYKQGEVFPQKIRVFNQDYIQKNVNILEGRAKSISILLGEQNKELITAIENDKKILNGDPSDRSKPGKILLREESLRESDRKSVARDGKFTDVAKTIGAAIGGNALRDYRKPQAEKDFAAISTKTELSEEDLKKVTDSAKQESLALVDNLALLKIRIDETDLDVATLLESSITESRDLLCKTVESEVIARLIANKDISEWVEQGIRIHANYKSDACEYCQQKIPTERIEQLKRHFNETDKKLKNDIDILISKINKVNQSIQALNVPDKVRFYKDLQEPYVALVSKYDSSKLQVLSDITNLIEELKSKKNRTTESLTLGINPDLADFSAILLEINQTIDKHNQNTSGFDQIKKNAIQKIKTHYLSTIYDEVKKYDAEKVKLSEGVKLLGTEIEEVRKRIAENESKVSSDHKACEIINENLIVFLGHKELSFVPDAKKEAVTGYIIMRGNEPAVYLSEGEKTAIAFVYFVVHLGDKDFSVKDGIVVIDDPISSLDSNSIYQAFSFLKNTVKECNQVFIFTHNFDFLKLLINWRKHAGGAGYYMIKNHFPDNIRQAYIDEMDKELYKYESEYHYLFKLLKQLISEQDDTIAKAYPVPNIARKVWDTFLMFAVPSGDSTQYKKMEKLKAKGFDAQKLDAIYKFTNDLSHITGAGFNPALVAETKNVVSILFEMMKAILPDHFEFLDEATN